VSHLDAAKHNFFLDFDRQVFLSHPHSSINSMIVSPHALVSRSVCCRHGRRAHGDQSPLRSCSWTRSACTEARRPRPTPSARSFGCPTPCACLTGTHAQARHVLLLHRARWPAHHALACMPLVQARQRAQPDVRLRVGDGPARHPEHVDRLRPTTTIAPQP
jgi:hypothetical protein